MSLTRNSADLADVGRLVAEVVALGAQLQVGEQADRHALGDRAEHDVAAARRRGRGSQRCRRALAAAAAPPARSRPEWSRSLRSWCGRWCRGPCRRARESRSRFSGQSICSIEASKTFMRAATDGSRVERADAVVEQERRRRPEADQRRHARVAAPAGRHLVRHRLAGERIVQRDRADRRQLLVGLRREVVPDVAGRARWSRAGCRRWCAAASPGCARRSTGSCPRGSRAPGTIVAHLLLVVVGLGPGPVALEAVEVARARALSASRSSAGGRPAPCSNGSARRCRRRRPCRARASRASAFRYWAPPGASFRWSGCAAFRKNSAVAGVPASVACQ